MTRNSVISASILDIDVWLKKSSIYWLSSWVCLIFSFQFTFIMGKCGWVLNSDQYTCWRVNFAILYICVFLSRLLSVSALWIILRKTFVVIIAAWDKKVLRASHGPDTQNYLLSSTMLLVNQWIRSASEEFDSYSDAKSWIVIQSWICIRRKCFSELLVYQWSTTVWLDTTAAYFLMGRYILITFVFVVLIMYNCIHVLQLLIVCRLEVERHTQCLVKSVSWEWILVQNVAWYHAFLSY
jgi:hypothetical protein